MGTENDDKAAQGKELEALISHARWLIEFHDKRGDQVSTRSVALLGFIGVISALLTRGVDLAPRLAPTVGLWVTLFATLAALLLSAIFALRTITTREVTAPSAEAAQTDWKNYVDGTRRGTALADIAESFYNAGGEDAQGNPIIAAKTAADDRVSSFKRSLRLLLVALIGVAALIVQTYAQAGR